MRLLALMIGLGAVLAQPNDFASVPLVVTADSGCVTDVNVLIESPLELKVVAEGSNALARTVRLDDDTWRIEFEIGDCAEGEIAKIVLETGPKERTYPIKVITAAARVDGVPTKAKTMNGAVKVK